MSAGTRRVLDRLEEAGIESAMDSLDADCSEATPDAPHDDEAGGLRLPLRGPMPRGRVL